MTAFELFGTIAIKNKDALAALSDTVQRAERAGKQIQETFKKVGSATVKAGQTIGKAALAVKAAWVANIETTRDYRTAIAKLDTAFTTNGHSAETATKTYKALQAVLGDTDQAVEAANHLAIMCKNEEELNKWTDICTGVFAQFGDSLPLEGLTEAANETVKVGQVTGSLADALNWAGISEEDFNLKLRACRTEQERQNLILNTLYPKYRAQAEQYKENAESIMRANEANDTLTRAMSRLGAVGEPILSGLKLWIADMVNAAVPHFETLIGKLTNFHTTMETEVWPWFQKQAKAILGIDLPTWEDIKTDITTKWTNLKTNIEEIAIAAMKFTPPDWGKLKEGITKELKSFITPEMEESLKEIGGGLKKAFGTGTDVISTVLEGAQGFGQWCVDNKETVKDFFSTLTGNALDNGEGAVSVLGLFHDAISRIAEIGVEKVTGALQWCINNGDKVATGMNLIAGGLMAGAIAAHPYAAAIMAIVTGLEYLLQAEEARANDVSWLDKYSDEELASLQRYIDAQNELIELENAWNDKSVPKSQLLGKEGPIRQRLEEAKAEVDAVEGLMDDYDNWANAHSEHRVGGYIDVPARLAEGTEAEVQAELNSMGLEAPVKMRPDYSGFSYSSTGGSLGRTRPLALSHASGLDSVPYDGYFARLHKGETVLNKVEADTWRGGNSGKVEALLSQVVTLLAQQKNIVLDSGVMVGQLAPAMDTRLGTIGNRKGRGN